jgi:hypothetical protein
MNTEADLKRDLTVHQPTLVHQPIDTMRPRLSELPIDSVRDS